MKDTHELSYDQLRKIFNPEFLKQSVSKKAPEEQSIVGQKRALAALTFGLGIQDGFHVYVSGQHGTGRMTTVKMYLQQIARKQPKPPDWCYVNNFEDPYKPKALTLPAGRGYEFQRDVLEFIGRARTEIPKAFENDEYSSQRDQIFRDSDDLKNKQLEELKVEADTLGFFPEKTQTGIILLPIVDGKTLTVEELQSMPVEKQNEIHLRREKLETLFKSKMKELNKIDQQAYEKFKNFERDYAANVVDRLIDQLVSKYKTLPDIVDYLKSVEKNILDNIEIFKQAVKIERSASFPFFGAIELLFRRYKVNVLTNHSRTDGAPVVVDQTGSYSSLFGRLDKEAQLGTQYTDFTLIKAGAIHRANGGYLVLEVEDLLKNRFAWDALMLALRSKQIRIEDPSEKLGISTGMSLFPETIPLNVKVILIGSYFIYYILHTFLEEFAETFKINAEFDSTMASNEENIQSFISLLGNFCKNEKTKDLTFNGAAKLAEFACRLAEDQQKLSTRFGTIADVLREADYWCKSENASAITEEHVKKAIEQRLYRSSMVMEHLQEMTLMGTHLIDTEGSVVAQINGLSVFTTGDCTFGRPTRITATSAPGRQGIIDIEREAHLGGPIHSKGVLILSGYLSQRFAQDSPLSLSARIVFEQSYSGVEGDSASCAELCALLSNLSELPLDQGIAVTGSVNQHGKLQAIGGVNEKVEGFFDLCRLRGLNGKQGVVIPKSNVQNLMLREDVIEAVKNSQFHVWAMENVDQVLQILTDVEAGEFEDKSYPIGTVNYLVYAKLKKFAASIGETAVPW
jgi:lon-related putative ATP-dependent protease